jgi:hypothetical protein
MPAQAVVAHPEQPSNWQRDTDLAKGSSGLRVVKKSPAAPTFVASSAQRLAEMMCGFLRRPDRPLRQQADIEVITVL